MFQEVIKIKGKKKGLSSIVLAGVHGDERCGIEAFEKIIPSLKIEEGVVFFGYGNPCAIEENKRYTEEDLNRMFNPEINTLNKSYEYNRAQFLKKYLDKTTALLDIHSTSIIGSKPFVICEENAKDIVKFLPVKIIVSGFDKVELGGTDYYMNKNQKIGVCVECGYTKDTEAVKIAKKSIINFLKARGHIKNNNLSPQKQTYIEVFEKYFTKTNNFTLSKPFKNFETVFKNQMIGVDGESEVKAKQKTIILFACNSTKKGEGVFLLGKKKKSLCAD
jgi:succinylglutamate desuccinylase